MPSDDLSSVPGLEDKYLRVLARNGVIDLRGLAQADPEVIYRAMANLRPRPQRDQIASWQDDARSMLLSQTAPDPAGEMQPAGPEWLTAASFVIVFRQRQADGTWERRAEAERTEVEPEANLQVWSDWDCEPICVWMIDQLDQAAHAGERAGEIEPPSEKPTSPRSALHIDHATFTDAAGRADVPTVSGGDDRPGQELVAPVRVAFTVSGAPPKTRLQAVTRILNPDGPGWNAHDPVAVPDSGRVEFDLSGLPAGEHDMALVAWAPDATVAPITVTVNTVRIHPG